MSRTVLLLALVLTDASAGEWTPLPSVHPHQILNEAREDQRAGRHDIALAKHVWYHNNALTLDPTQAGVRLSYALADWNRLGKEYPPALAKLRESRDGARASVLAGREIHQSFMDLDAINRVLDQRAVTAELFRELDRRNTAAAALVYPLAGASLVLEKDYALYAKYLRPAEDYARALTGFQLQLAMPFMDRKTPEQLFSNKVATLVSVLAATGRAREAQDIAAKARKDWDDGMFSAALDRALSGMVPQPFP